MSLCSNVSQTDFMDDEGLSTEQKVRLHPDFIGATISIRDVKFNYLMLKSPSGVRQLGPVFIYASTPEELWPKALAELIRRRLVK